MAKLSGVSSRKKKSVPRPKAHPGIGSKEQPIDGTIAQQSESLENPDGLSDRERGLCSIAEAIQQCRRKTKARCALANWRHNRAMRERSAVESVIAREQESALAIVRGKRAVREQWQAIGIPRPTIRPRPQIEFCCGADGESFIWCRDGKGYRYDYPVEKSGDYAKKTVSPIQTERHPDCFSREMSPVEKFARTIALEYGDTINAAESAERIIAAIRDCRSNDIDGITDTIHARDICERDGKTSRSHKLTSDARNKPYRQDTSWLTELTDEQRSNLKEFGQLYAPKNGKQCVLDFFAAFNCPILGTLNHKTGDGIAQIVDLDVDCPQFHEFAKRLSKRLAVREGVPLSMVSGERVRYRKGFASMLEKQAAHESALSDIEHIIESEESIDVESNGEKSTIRIVTTTRDESENKKARKRVESATASIQRKADNERKTHDQSEFVADVLAECVLLQLQAKAGERPFGFAAVRRLVRRYVQRLGIDRVKRDMVARLNLTNAALAQAKPETIGNQTIWQVGQGIYSESAQPKRGVPAAQIESAYVPVDPLSDALERGGLKLRLSKAQETTRDEERANAKTELLELLASGALSESQTVFLLQFLASDCNQARCAESLGIAQQNVSARLRIIRAKMIGETISMPSIPLPTFTKLEQWKRRALTVGIDNRREARAELDNNGRPIVKARHYSQCAYPRFVPMQTRSPKNNRKRAESAKTTS